LPNRGRPSGKIGRELKVVDLDPTNVFYRYFIVGHAAKRPKIEAGVKADNLALARKGNFSRAPHISGMRFEIEFLQHSNEHPDGIVIRRNSGQFARERDVEIHAITGRPEDAEGFRILRDGVVRKDRRVDPNREVRTPEVQGHRGGRPGRQCVTVTANRTMIAALREPITANGTSSFRYVITTLDG
jgi:hypothetical protein